MNATFVQCPHPLKNQFSRLALAYRSTPGSLDLSRSHKRMDSSPLYSNDSNDGDDDDMAPPTMVPRADLQPRNTRGLEEDEEDFGEDVEEMKVRSSRSHQKYLALQRRALEEYEMKREQELTSKRDDDVIRGDDDDVDDDDEDDDDHMDEPDAKKVRVEVICGEGQDREGHLGFDDPKEEQED